MTNASSTFVNSEPGPRSQELDQWVLPAKDGTLSVALVPQEVPLEVPKEVPLNRATFYLDDSLFFSVQRLHSAQHVFPLVMGWPTEASSRKSGKARLRFAVIIAGDEGPMGDRPVVGEDESPLASSVKLAELLQVLNAAALQLGLPVLHMIPQGSTISISLEDGSHCVASWVLLRAFFESALSARGLLLDDATVEVDNEIFALDGGLAYTSV